MVYGEIDSLELEKKLIAEYKLLIKEARTLHASSISSNNRIEWQNYYIKAGERNAIESVLINHFRHDVIKLRKDCNWGS